MDLTVWKLAQAQVGRLMEGQFALPQAPAGLEPDPPKEGWPTRLARALGQRRTSKPAVPKLSE